MKHRNRYERLLHVLHHRVPDFRCISAGMGVDLVPRSISSDEVVKVLAVVLIATVLLVVSDYGVKNRLRIQRIVRALFRHCRKDL